MTYFCPHIEVEQRPRYRRASNPTLEVIQRQKCSKITIFYYFAKARVKARSSTSKARSSNTKIEPRLGLGSSSKMKSSNSSKLDNFRLVAPLVFTQCGILLTCIETHIALQKLTTTNVTQVSHCCRLKLMSGMMINYPNEVFFFFWLNNFWSLHFVLQV